MLALKSRLLKAILLLSYHGCLRVGEMVYCSHEYNSLFFENRGFTSGGDYQFKLHAYKHALKPLSMILAPLKNPQFGPVIVLLSFYSIRPRVIGAAFADHEGGNFKRGYVPENINKLINMVGKSPKDYTRIHSELGEQWTWHCLELVRPPSEKSGRWKSNAYLGYRKVHPIPPGRFHMNGHQKD